MKKILGVFAILVFSAIAALAQQGKPKNTGEKVSTLAGPGNSDAAKSAAPGQVQKATGTSASDVAKDKNQAAGQGQVAGATDAGTMPDAVTPDMIEAAAPSTEGMTPAQAAKAKYMHKNEKLKARNSQAEARLAESKAKIAKSKASLESKKKKGKISAADYEAGMAKIKAAEEKMQYLETMVGEAKQKTF